MTAIEVKSKTELLAVLESISPLNLTLTITVRNTKFRIVLRDSVGRSNNALLYLPDYLPGAWEVEIKVTKADLIKDKSKRHGHRDDRIKYLYFAIPQYLKRFINHIPERAGIIIVGNDWRCRTINRPTSNKTKYKFSDREQFQIARLGAIRIWDLKRKLQKS